MRLKLFNSFYNMVFGWWVSLWQVSIGICNDGYAWKISYVCEYTKYNQDVFFIWDK